MLKNKKYFLLALLWPLFFNSVAQVSGTYTVGGTSPDFSTIQSAFDFLKSKGVNGNVRLNLRSGIYNERVTITYIYGVSGSKTIKVAPDPKNKGPVVIKNKPKDQYTNYLIKMNQDYIEFDSLIFKIDSSSRYGGRVMDYSYDCDYVTFNACTFFGKDTTSNSNDFAILYDAGGIVMNYYRFYNCTFYNGSYSLFHNGTSSKDEVGTEVKNCKFINYYDHAISMSYQKSPIITGNYSKDINKYSAAYGMTFMNCDSAIISGNKIYCNNGYCLYFESGNGSATSPNMIVNNFVSVYDSSKSSFTAALYLSGGKYNYVYYNSFLSNGQHQYSRAVSLFNLGTSGQNTIFKNNNVVHNASGNAIYMGTPFSGISAMDYNNYYSKSSRIAYIGKDVNTLNDFRTATGMDANSINKSITFKSSTDLHTTTLAINQAGTPIAGITKDIDNETRNATKPDIGADEYTPPYKIDAAIVGIGNVYCPDSSRVNVVLKNAGLDTLKKAKIEWAVSVNGGTFKKESAYSFKGALASEAESALKLGNYKFNKNDKYLIKVWVTNPNDSTDKNKENDTLISSPIKLSLNGTYSIGGSKPDFSTVDSAFNFAERYGICGPVRFNLRRGTYNEQITITAIPGASSSNTVTLAADPSDSIMPVITYSAPVYTSNYVIKIKSSPYLSFDSIKIVAAGKAYAKALVFEGKNKNIILSGDSIIGLTGASNSEGTLVYVTKDTGNFFGNCTIKNCIFINGYNGISLADQSINDICFDNKIIDNKFFNFARGGIVSNYQARNIISGNYLMSRIVTDARGMDVYGNDSCTVTNNQVYLSGKTEIIGIMFRSCDGSVSSPPILANNVVTIYQTNPNAETRGIYAAEGKNNKFAHNTAVIYGGNYISSPFHATYTTTVGNSVELFNNSFANYGIGYGVNWDITSGIASMDNNNYFTLGKVFANYGNYDSKDLKDYKLLTGFENNSLNFNPFFKDSFNLIPTQSRMSNKAKPLTYIKQDITGKYRDSLKPDIGAYEYDPPANDISIESILIFPTQPCGSDSAQVSVVIKNTGIKSQSNFDVNLNLNTKQIFKITFSDSLKSGIEDTLFLGSVYTKNGGVFYFKAFSGLTTDEDFKNDTVLLTRVFNSAPGMPGAKNVTVCVNIPFALTTTKPSQSVLRWYNAPKNGKLLREGEILNVNALKKDTAFYVAAAQPTVFNDSLITTTAGGTSCGGGIMFEIKAKASLKLDSLKTLAQNQTLQKIYIYYKNGGVTGFEKNKAAWKLIDSVNVKPVSTTDLFTIGLSKLPAFKKDSLYSIYLNYHAIYTKSVVSFENSDLKLNPGIGLCTKFNNTTTGRIFNGKLFYNKTLFCESNRAKIDIKVKAAKINLGKDTSFCEKPGINYLLDPGSGYDSYKWLSNDTSQTLKVVKEGKYGVTITDITGCSAYDEIIISKKTNPTVNIGSDTSYCKNPGINFSLKTNSKFTLYDWNTKENTQSINIKTEGKYYVTVWDSSDCAASDTLIILENQNPTINLGKDTSYCANDGINLALNAGKNYKSYRWSTSDTTEFIKVNMDGIYHVEVVDNNLCEGSDTIAITKNQNPSINLGSDKLLDPDLPINETLDAGAGYISYQWNKGKTTQTIKATQVGKFWVMVTNKEGCVATDTIIINTWTKGGITKKLKYPLTIFPNPADKLLSIIAPIKIDEIKIYSITGLEIYSATDLENKTCIEISLWPNGIYIMKTRVDSEIYFIKIDVVHE